MKSAETDRMLKQRVRAENRWKRENKKTFGENPENTTVRETCDIKVIPIHVNILKSYIHKLLVLVGLVSP